MTREELIGVNAGIVKSVAQNILKYSPNRNPGSDLQPDGYNDLPVIEVPGSAENRIIGMGGALDSSRFKYFCLRL